MKKGLKLTSAAFLAVSALTPVAVFANEETTETPANGFYTADGYVEYLSELSKSDIKALFKDLLRGDTTLVVVLDGTVYEFTQGNAELLLSPDTTLEDLEEIAQTYEEYQETTGKDLDTDFGIVDPKADAIEAANTAAQVAQESAEAVAELAAALTDESTQEEIAEAKEALASAEDDLALAEAEIEAATDLGVTEEDLAEATAAVEAATAAIAAATAAIAAVDKAPVTPVIESVAKNADIPITEGATPTLPEKVTVTYTNGTTGDVAVVWNTTGADFTKAGTYTLPGTIEGTDKTASVNVVVVAKTLQVESVSAINATKVEVKFSVAVDAVTKENFTIAGVTVTEAKLSEDKKTAVLDVTKLAYGTKYTVAVKDVKVEGKAVEFGSKEFTTPAVTEAFKLKVTPTATVVTANGADNTVIKFELLNAAGQVDTNANNMVLEIGTTFGNLATNRVTVQNGVGQVVLSSEFDTKEVIAKVTAQIIEASADYKELIGNVAGEATVKFTPSVVTTDPNAVTFQDAESNQADRVILYFDKPVSAATFVQTNTDGTFKTTVDKKQQLLKSNVTISIKQGAISKNIVGVIPVAGNDKAVAVLLDTTTTLKDNAQVDLEVKIGTTQNKRSFTLTDARQPEFTGVTATNLRTLELKFSEAIDSGNFSINGIWNGEKVGKLEDPILSPTTNQFKVKFGEFDAVKGTDKRDTATVSLDKSSDSTPKPLYFKSGLNSITVTQLKDFAANATGGDNGNISTTQTLNFTVAADTTAPLATVKVESPEQIRVTFNKDVVAVDPSGTALNDAQLTQLFIDNFKVYDETAKAWKKLSDYTDKFKNATFPLTNILKVTNYGTTSGVFNQYVLELNDDWTQILQKSDDAYYNYKFKLELPEKSFQSLTNGQLNAKTELDLSTADSPLTKADNVSPVINDIVQTTDASTFEITMSEPVKLNNKTLEPETLALNQTSLPIVLAEFQGKDKNGKAVVIQANVNTYTDKDGKVKIYTDSDGGDKKFQVTTSGTTLQSLVNTGHNENWTVVVRSISDDIGNTASTLTKDFTVKPSVTTAGFVIKSLENGFGDDEVVAFNATKPTDKDRIEVTFTKGVNVAGPDNLTSVYNWTLNGTKLSNLSNVESIKVENVAGTVEDGYEKVIITFADDRAFGNVSNVVSVTKGIKSLDGTVLSGEFEVVSTTTGHYVDIHDKAPASVTLNAASDPVTTKTLVAFKKSDLARSEFENAPASILELELTPAGSTTKETYNFKSRTLADGTVVYFAEVPTSKYTGSTIKVVGK